MNNFDRVLKRLQLTLAGRAFFWFIVGLLIFQAVWIALTGHYPMAFDEDFHLGVIRIYAHHLSPFLPGQPSGADTYGAVARDPSYLYHYLFSFPYRLISAFTHNQSTQVIILRLLNILLFASSLVLYRRLLKMVGAPQVLINACLLIFVLIPVVPLLAAQINYDNLFIPAIAGCLLLSVRFANRLRQREFDMLGLLLLITACLLTSLVKYAFLPVFMAVCFYVVFLILQISLRPESDLRSMVRCAIKDANRYKLAGVALLTLLAIGLFSQRYVVNIARYGTPVPDCSKALSVKQCSAYGPWIRDYNFAVNNLGTSHNPIVFSGDWLYGMWLRLYFSVDGPATLYETRGPLPIPALSAIAIAAVGFVALVIGFRRLLHRYNPSTILLSIGTTIVYVSILWLDNYRAYIRTGQPVAINGRYLLPFVPIVLVLSALAGHELLKKLHQARLAGLIVGVVLLSQIWGGGLQTYIVRSNDSWYWQHAGVQPVNHLAQKILKPVTPGRNTPTQFLR